MIWVEMTWDWESVVVASEYRLSGDPVEPQQSRHGDWYHHHLRHRGQWLHRSHHFIIVVILLVARFNWELTDKLRHNRDYSGMSSYKVIKKILKIVDFTPYGNQIANLLNLFFFTDSSRTETYHNHDAQHHHRRDDAWPWERDAKANQRHKGAAGTRKDHRWQVRQCVCVCVCG